MVNYLRAVKYAPVSVLFNEPKLLKVARCVGAICGVPVSVLFNEPKLLKSVHARIKSNQPQRFSALQRAEIAEIDKRCNRKRIPPVSVLFNEPKLLKAASSRGYSVWNNGFSALQRAEIAEIRCALEQFRLHCVFQCSSTSRNC